MAKSTSVTLGSHYEKLITGEIAEGRFGSASEAIRAGVRLLEERQTRLALLRQALEEGEQSGTAEYSLDALLEELDRESLS